MPDIRRTKSCGTIRNKGEGTGQDTLLGAAFFLIWCAFFIDDDAGRVRV